MSDEMEVRAGIEPTFADLQSAASPLCHRTPSSAELALYVVPDADGQDVIRPAW